MLPYEYSSVSTANTPKMYEYIRDGLEVGPRGVDLARAQVPFPLFVGSWMLERQGEVWDLCDQLAVLGKRCGLRLRWNINNPPSDVATMSTFGIYTTQNQR